MAAELGPHIIPATVDRALDADIIFFAVGTMDPSMRRRFASSTML
jgi:hypothetical protein